MVDWEKEILENRQRKQQEKERREKMEEEQKTTKGANRKKAISFISDVAVPAFEKAKKMLEGDKLNMSAWYEPPQKETFIKMEVNSKDEQNTKNQKFQYLVDMEYTSSTVTPYAECTSGVRHKIENSNNNSAIPRISGELVNITVDDVCEDLMECFADFDNEDQSK